MPDYLGDDMRKTKGGDEKEEKDENIKGKHLIRLVSLVFYSFMSTDQYSF